jgi:hypothetical protein
MKRTQHEILKTLYKQDGSCSGIRCLECPFFKTEICEKAGEWNEPDKKVKEAAKDVLTTCKYEQKVIECDFGCVEMMCEKEDSEA